MQHMYKIPHGYEILRGPFHYVNNDCLQINTMFRYCSKQGIYFIIAFIAFKCSTWSIRYNAGGRQNAMRNRRGTNRVTKLTSPILHFTKNL